MPTVFRWPYLHPLCFVLSGRYSLLHYTCTPNTCCENLFLNWTAKRRTSPCILLLEGDAYGELHTSFPRNSLPLCFNFKFERSRTIPTARVTAETLPVVRVGQLQEERPAIGAATAALAQLFRPYCAKTRRTRNNVRGQVTLNRSDDKNRKTSPL